jgi:D-sedoheptulose 7-phosphate isomerase
VIRQRFLDYCQGLKQALDAVSADAVEELVQLLERACQEGRQVFLMGNGGSGSTASHVACDLNKGVSFGRQKRFRAICLNDNLPTVMAYANDVSYEDIFVEPLKNFLRPGDVVIGLSGSGNSANVLKAIDYANQHGALTVGLSGYDGGKLARLVRMPLVVPVHDMQKAEEVHLTIFHVAMQTLCVLIEPPTGAPPEPAEKRAATLSRRRHRRPTLCAPLTGTDHFPTGFPRNAKLEAARASEFPYLAGRQRRASPYRGPKQEPTRGP